MSNSFYQRQFPLQPWLMLAVGYLIGGQGQTVLQNFYAFVDKWLVPLYAFLVVVYISELFRVRYLFPQKKRLVAQKEAKIGAAPESALAEEGVVDEQPCDLSGAYKLVSLENFDAFLEVQGVPWALRKAACKARPIHRIKHKGSRITIRIEGIIETETTYIINGPPVEINIRGRIFRDQYTYLESGDGIKGIKKAITENYDVHVQRKLSEDKQKLTLISKAVFQDGRDPVECTQIFERCE